MNITPARTGRLKWPPTVPPAVYSPVAVPEAKPSDPIASSPAPCRLKIVYR
jgi:hypothetical protein